MGADPRLAKPWLWIVPKWTFPAQDGARMATLNLLSQITASGVTVDYLALAGEEEQVDPEVAKRLLGVRDVHVIRREPVPTSKGKAAAAALGALLRNPGLPVTMRYYGAAGVARQVDALLASENGGWGTVVYDGLHSAAHSRKAGKFAGASGAQGPLRVLYRAHNYETGIWNRKAAQTRNPAFKAFLSYQASLVQKFEDSMAAHADGVATVSEEDLTLFRKKTPELKGATVPIGYRFSEPPAFPKGPGLQLMFLGRMDWPPNRDGLQWFLRNVWPRVAPLRPDLSVAVAGSGDCTWLKDFSGLDRVRFLGRVDSVEALYAESALSLVPVFYGGGTRVKAIEACRFARPCLSTVVGVEGVGLRPGQDYLQAETPDEWVSCLKGLTLDQARSLGKSSFERARGVFDSAATAARFIALARGE